MTLRPSTRASNCTISNIRICAFRGSSATRATASLARARPRARLDRPCFGRRVGNRGIAINAAFVDPPAFAKTKRAVEGALRGYRELNLRALKMLRPGGRLITCSCSHHVSLGEFMEVLRAAAGDARRRVRLLEVRGAAADHPVVLNIPETEYLKCVILEAE